MIHILIYLQYPSLIPTPVTVVRRGENGHHVIVVTHTIAIHDQLMGPRDQLQAVRMVELLTDVLPECITSPAWAYTPATAFVRI